MYAVCCCVWIGWGYIHNSPFEIFSFKCGSKLMGCFVVSGDWETARSVVCSVPCLCCNWGLCNTHGQWTCELGSIPLCFLCEGTHTHTQREGNRWAQEVTYQQSCIHIVFKISRILSAFLWACPGVPDRQGLQSVDYSIGSIVSVKLNQVQTKYLNDFLYYLNPGLDSSLAPAPSRLHR